LTNETQAEIEDIGDYANVEERRKRGQFDQYEPQAKALIKKWSRTHGYEEEPRIWEYEDGAWQSYSFAENETPRMYADMCASRTY
jgi:hypothetical protein